LSSASTIARGFNETNGGPCAYGLDGSLIDFGKQQAIPARQLLPELVEFVDEVVDDLASRSAVEYATKSSRRAPALTGQLATYQRTQRRSEAVVDKFCRETLDGVPVELPD